jgi:hypothetical protein
MEQRVNSILDFIGDIDGSVLILIEAKDSLVS